jgi:hypothetical protein
MIPFKKNAKIQIGGLILSLFLILLFMGCKSEDSTNAQDLEDRPDSTAIDNGLIKISEKKLPDLTVNKPIIRKYIDENFEKNKQKIEKKFGDQWDFCRCVRMNDSLDKQIKNDIELDDAFLKKLDEVELKCKAFLTMSPNHTPDERSLHQKKIRECLKL